MKPKLYSYIRMSTEKQLRDGDSLRRQMAKTYEFAEKHGLEVDESTTFQDLGVSSFRGANFKEGQLGKLMAMVNEGLIPKGSYLAMESFDRFSRMEPVDVLPRFTDIIKAGVKLATLIDGQVYDRETISDNPYLLMTSIIQMQLAHEESRKKSQRLGAAWGNKFELAKTVGKKLTQRCPGWMTLNKAANKFELIPERVAVVQQIFQMTIDGIGKRKVADILNEKQTPTFGKSNFWHTSYIAKVLDTRAVLGEIQPYKAVTIEGVTERVPDGDPIENYYPPVITEEQFYAAKAARASRILNAGRKGRQYSNIFGGIAVCGQCTTPVDKSRKAKLISELEDDPNFLVLSEEDKCLEVGKITSRHTSMKFLNKGKHGEQYLVCEGMIRKSGCQNDKYWNYHYLEESILTFCKYLDLTDAFAPPSANRVDPISKLESEREITTQKIEKLKKDTGILIEFILGDEVDQTMIKEKINANQKTLTELEDKLARIDRSKTKLLNQKVDQEAFTKSLEDLFGYISTAEPTEETFARRAKISSILKKVVSKIEIYSDGRFMDGQREFVIHYHNGEQTAVIPNPNNGREYRIIRERDEKGNILREERVSLS